jgi:DNA-directed RNA polymerase specialized sigma24 family protein
MDREAICRAIDEHAEEIYVRLGSYIRRMTFARGLPPGFEKPEEIIHEAVGRVISGTRSFDPARESIVMILHGTIRSMLSKEKGLYAREGRKPLGKIAADVEPAPQEEEHGLLSGEEAERRWAAVESIVANDQELLDYFAAVRLGFEKPAEIAEAMGIKIERVYEIPRKIERLAPQIREQFAELENQ